MCKTANTSSEWGNCGWLFLLIPAFLHFLIFPITKHICELRKHTWTLGLKTNFVQWPWTYLLLSRIHICRVTKYIQDLEKAPQSRRRWVPREAKEKNNWRSINKRTREILARKNTHKRKLSGDISTNFHPLEPSRQWSAWLTSDNRAGLR